MLITRSLPTSLRSARSSLQRTASLPSLTAPVPASCSLPPLSPLSSALPCSTTLRATFSTTSSKMSDTYTQAAAAAPSLSEKLAALRAFIGTQKALTLTTRAADGSLHARVMAVAEITKDWKFRFLYDRDSHKDDEVENDAHVNISANGANSNTGWASIAGQATIKTDRALIEHLYNPTIKAWFADKGDGVHTGEVDDPRIGALEVRVNEIRHFHQQKTAVGTVVDIVASTVSGKVATPGEVRTITGEEISGAWAKNELKEP